MNKIELNQIRELDYSRELNSISKTLRSYKSYDPILNIAAAYILYSAAINPDISLHTINDFLATARLPEGRKFFIEDLFHDKWDAIRKLGYTLETDKLKALILFADPLQNNRGDFSTPYGISRLAAELLDIKPNDSVIDLGCGCGNFLRDSYGYQPDAVYTGLEINTYCTEIAAIRAEMLGENIVIEQGDMLCMNEEEKRSFDKIFSNYPLAEPSIFVKQKPSLSMQENFQRFPSLKKASKMEWFYNTVLVSLMKENGRAIGIAPLGSVFSLPETEIRSQFIEQGLLEKVILLPEKVYAPFTNILMVMFVFSSGNQSVQMIDASKFYKANRRNESTLTVENADAIYDLTLKDSEYSRWVSYEEMLENNFNLDPRRYLYMDEKIENGVPLKSLITEITRGAQIKADELEKIMSSEPFDAEFLMLMNINDGMIDPKLPRVKSDGKYDRYLINPDSLVISKVSKPLKISVADIRADRKIIAGGNLYVLKLDETKANPYYVKAFLESHAGQNAMKIFSTGSVIEFVSIENLKEIMIPMIPIEEQNRFAEEYKQAMEDVCIMRKRTENAVDRMKNLFDSWAGGADETA